jgi:RHS repeat-associated protein
MAGFGEAQARAARDKKLAQIANELLVLPPDEQARAMDAALAELGGAEDAAAFFAPTLDYSGQSVSGGEFTAESGSGGESPAQSSTSTVLWLLPDNLGTTRDVIDNSGAAVNHITYAAFGAITAITGAFGQALSQSATRYLYTQREFDFTTHLNYHRARYYDPSAGRWLSEDPISFSAGDTNLQRYVGNSATNGTDPSGDSGVMKWDLMVDSPLPPPGAANFWEDAVAAAEALQVPAGLLNWNSRNKTPVEISTERPHYDRGTIYIDEIAWRRYNRIGSTKGLAMTEERGLGALYNEAFHAWYDAYGAELNQCLVTILRSEEQYPWFRREHMAEEAMSNLVEAIADALERGARMPTYEEALELNAWDDALRPKHNQPGEKWHGVEAANRPMSKELYYATYYVLHFPRDLKAWKHYVYFDNAFFRIHRPELLRRPPRGEEFWEKLCSPELFGPPHHDRGK